jgi:ankyrin repeat protein
VHADVLIITWHALIGTHVSQRWHSALQRTLAPPRAHAPLHACHGAQAAEFGRTGAALALLQHPLVTADAPSAFGTAPLIAACVKGHAGVAKALLAAGADPSLRAGNSGLTPLQVRWVGAAMAVCSLQSSDASVPVKGTEGSCCSASAGTAGLDRASN